MASRLPAAVDKLRRHLHDAIPDKDDFQQADRYILDLLNSLHDDGMGEGEAEGEDRGRDQVNAPEKYWGGKAMDGRMGLDRALVGARVRKTTPDGVLKKLLDGTVQPGRAEAVR